MRHPVLGLGFGGGNFQEPISLYGNFMAQLDETERRMGVASEYETGPERLVHLLEVLHLRTGHPVVVLVDEYDKPILDTFSPK